MTAASADVMKRWSTLRARLVLAGYQAELLEGDDGRIEMIASRWVMTRSFSDIDTATTWVGQVLGNEPISQPGAGVPRSMEAQLGSRTP